MQRIVRVLGFSSRSPRWIWAGLLGTSLAMAGTWGIDAFANDEALDWVDELEKSSGAGLLGAALNDVNSFSGYIEAPACANALAAAEVIAAARGHASRKVPADVTAWLKRAKPGIDADLLARARKAVAFCRNADNSELRALWKDSKDFDAWMKDTADLLARLE